MHLHHILDAICNFTSSLRGCVDYFQEGWTPTCEGWSITGTSQATNMRYKHITYTALYICLCEGWSISFGRRSEGCGGEHCHHRPKQQRYTHLCFAAFNKTYIHMVIFDNTVLPSLSFPACFEGAVSLPANPLTPKCEYIIVYVSVRWFGWETCGSLGTNPLGEMYSLRLASTGKKEEKRERERD